MLTISDVDVNELGEDAPMDHGTSILGDNGSLLGTMVLLLLSLQSSTPEGQVGTASTVPERPCTIMSGIDKLFSLITMFCHDYFYSWSHQLGLLVPQKGQVGTASTVPEIPRATRSTRAVNQFRSPVSNRCVGRPQSS